MSDPGTNSAAGRDSLRGQTPPSDDRLVRTFHEMRDELISTLMYIVGNRDDAQDVAQETFLKCWRNRDGIDSVDNLRAWVFRVGINAARDFHRSGWKRRSRPLLKESSMLVDRSISPHESAARREEIARLGQAILELRSEEKEVFLLRQNGGLTYEQIAEIRNCPVGTVKTQMRSALQKLRNILH